METKTMMRMVTTVPPTRGSPGVPESHLELDEGAAVSGEEGNPHHRRPREGLEAEAELPVEARARARARALALVPVEALALARARAPVPVLVPVEVVVEEEDEVDEGAAGPWATR
jgi:hypothetical protein